jgi:hypothetical protein
MARNQNSPNERRLPIRTFEGVNSFLAWNLADISELSHAENVRCNKLGILERRDGHKKISTTDNLNTRDPLAFFGFSNSEHMGVYYVIKDSEAGWSEGSLYYQKEDGSVGQCTGIDNFLFQISGSATGPQFDITNPSGNTFRYTYDGSGDEPYVFQKIYNGASIKITASNFNNNNEGEFTVTGAGDDYFEVTNASGVIESNKVLAEGDKIQIMPVDISAANVDNRIVFVNGATINCQLDTDFATIIPGDTTTSDLVDSPRAKKVNYYKGKIYLGDIRIGNNRLQNFVQFSSKALGLVSLIEGDYDAGVTSLDVSDTKYIKSSDSLDVYRGNTLIETLTISAKTETSITVNATSSAIKSADELWVAGTKTGSTTHQYRWADSIGIGSNLKRLDTFPLSGGRNEPILMMANVGDIMAISTKDNMAYWNGYSLMNLNTGYGCVSPNGYVKNQGLLFFIGNDGIYKTDGATMPEMISSPIERYITGATAAAKEVSAAGKLGFSVFFTLGDVTLYNEDGSTKKTLTDTLVEYNIRTDMWFVHTNFSTKYFTNYDTTTERELLAFPDTIATGIRKAFSSDRDYDEGLASAEVEIPLRFDTQDIQIADPGKAVEILKIKARLDRGNSVQVFVNPDKKGEFALKDTLQKGWSTIGVHGRDESSSSPLRCSSLEISLRNSSKTKCAVSYLEVVYRDLVEDYSDSNIKEMTGNY